MNWSFSKEAFNLLKEQVFISSPTGSETEFSSYLASKWKNKGLPVRSDVLGNLYTSIAGSNDLNVAILAHLDTVSLQVTDILPGGFLQFRSVGLQALRLVGQTVEIRGDDACYKGVVGFDPTSQYSKGLSEEDLWIDAGFTSQEEAESHISIGAHVVFSPRFSLMNDQFLCGTAMDNRIGMFVLDQCLDLLLQKRYPVNIHFVGTTQEEIALRGASVIAHHLPPIDACLILDVDYATDTPQSHSGQMGPLLLRKGVGFNVKSDNNPILQQLARRVADQSEIPYQLTVGRFPKGGTDASVVQLLQGGIATLNINIPCRYMHSPIEVCSVRDVEYAIRLIVNLVGTLAETDTQGFIPLAL